jgi:glycosyltransferase involved in cell wall biosynthesis
MLSTSIAMATFNGAPHIRQQLDSLVDQTLLPFELVVTDDGSTDNTLDIIQDFARTAPFPVFIHQNDQNFGYKANFMKCASLCRGDLIAFCDQDDIWYSEKISTITELMQISDTLLIYHTFRIFGQQQGARDGPIVDQRIEVGSPWAKVYGITEVFRRSLLRFNDVWPSSVDHFSPSEPMAHDQWMYFLAHAFGAATHLPRDLIGYRQHDQNVCGFQALKSGNRASNVLRNLGILGSRLMGSRDFVEKRKEMAAHWEGLYLGARNRAELMEDIRDRGIETPGLEASAHMVGYYQQLHLYYEARFKIFSGASRARRLSELFGLLRRGFYYRNGALGFRDGVIDLIYGVLA